MTATDPAWVPAAPEALHLAQRDRLHDAARVVEGLAVEHGDQAVPAAVMAWVDSLVHCADPTGFAHGRRAALVFRPEGTDDTVGAEGVDPASAWAGRLITARFVDDLDTVQALLVSAQASSRQWSDSVMAVLDMVAVNVNRLMAKRAEVTGS